MAAAAVFLRDAAAERLEAAVQPDKGAFCLACQLHGTQALHEIRVVIGRVKLDQRDAFFPGQLPEIFGDLPGGMGFARARSAREDDLTHAVADQRVERAQGAVLKTVILAENRPFAVN